MKLQNYIIHSDYKIIEAIERMQVIKTRDLLIQKNKKIVGTVSEGDILRGILRGKDLRNKIEDVSNTNFKFVEVGKEHKVVDIFKKEKVFIVPVFNKKFKLVNIITLSDFFDEFTK
jgi:mannose-1-phosphate guanylyltransferase / mannose-6-phosphate isomerase